MLQKSRSKNVWILRHLVSAPLIVGMWLCTSYELLAQEAKDASESSGLKAAVTVPFAVIEEVPVFPGCKNVGDPRACFAKMLEKHIAENFQYPVEAREKNIQGKVIVMFTIDEEGDITDITTRGPDPLLENEAERIVKLLPKMVPGKHRGAAVRVPFSRPIAFDL